MTPRVWNPPERSALSYRVATRDALFAMMQELTTQPQIAGSGAPNPLHRLPLEPSDGFVPALLDAWAVVGDVLTFYQERIANEGFLRTATEPLSQRELLRTLAHEPRPALSATCVFAFAMASPRTTTARPIVAQAAPAEALIPGGTPISAPPPPDGSPAPVFETGDDLVARAEWNAVAPAFPPPPVPSLANGGDAMRLSGEDVAMLRPGMPLIVRRRTVRGAVSDAVVTLTAVEPDAATKTVAFVRWTPALPPGEGALQFVTFRSSAALFGAKAPEWADLLPAIKDRYVTRAGGVYVARDGAAWSTIAAGAPKDDVIALRFGGGKLYALTASGVYRTDGTAWTALAPKARGALTALATTSGAVYVASDRGDVLASRDGGASWSPVGPSSPAAGAVAVHALAVREAPGTVPVVFAGTDRGLAVARDDGSAWVYRNAGFTGIGPADDAKPAPVAITALALRGNVLLASASTEPHRIWSRDLIADGASAGLPAGTWTQRPEPGTTAPFAALAFGAARAYAVAGAGILAASTPAFAWSAIPSADPGWSPRAIDAAGTSVVVDTPRGIALSRDGGATWSTIDASPPGRPVAVALEEGTGAVAYALPLAPYPSDWPNLALEGTGVDLERLVPVVTADAQVALVDAAPAAPRAQAARVVSAQTVRRKDFAQTGLVTHVELTPLDPGVDLAQFGRRTTRLFYDARVLGVAPDPVPSLQPLAGDRFTVDGTVTPFPAERLVAVYGQPIRARVVALAGGIRRVDATGAGTPWGLRGLDCRDLGAGPDGTVYAATSQGAWRRPPSADFAAWDDGGTPLRAIAASAKLILAAADVAAGPSVLHRAPDDDAWAAAAGPAGVTALLATPNGTTFWAGGTAGLARTDDGVTWRTVAERGAPGVNGEPITALAWAADGRTLLAGTPAGVAVRTPDGTWRRCVRGLDNRDVASLAAGPSTWYAGTNGGGVYASNDAGATWRHVPLALPPGRHAVRALAFDGVPYAAVRGYGVLRDGVPVDSGVGNDVRAFLVRPDGVLCAVRSGTALASETSEDQVISLRDLGAVEIAYAGDLNRGALPAALRTDLVTQLKIPLPPAVSVSTAGPGTWLLSADGIDDLLLREAPARVKIIVATVRSFVVAAPPSDAVNGARTWTVQSDEGNATFVARDGDVMYAAADADDPFAGEIATVAGTSPLRESGVTELRLTARLSRVYDGRTVQVLGNCARGSHGASGPTYEAIGDGDASRANQAFTLARRALATLQAADGTFVPQIGVVVRPAIPRNAIASAAGLRRDDAEGAGVVWAYVENLAEAGPEDRVFTVRFDDDVATVEFGDGISGSRLPTGSENVVANYRSGNGPAGNIEANSTLLLRKRSGGVNGVRNPIAATGGLAAEAPSDAVGAAHAGLRTLHRVVSLADLEDFAVARTGIAKAKVRIAGGRRRVAHLTIAGPAGDADDATKKALAAAIRGAGGAAMPVVLHDARRRYVRIAATLYVVAGLDRDAIAAAAIGRVRDAFAYARRPLGEGVVAARVLELLQDGAGITGVTLDALYDAVWSPIVAAAVPGEDVRSASDGELLVLLDPDPAQLQLEVRAS